MESKSNGAGTTAWKALSHTAFLHEVVVLGDRQEMLGLSARSSGIDGARAAAHLERSNFSGLERIKYCHQKMASGPGEMERVDVPENAGQISILASDLAGVRALLIAILVAVIVLAAAHLFRIALGSVKTFRTVWDDFFRDEAERLLETDKIDELVDLAKDKLTKQPNHVYAHWYLGRAYYLQDKWAEALAEFREVARIDPSWIDDHVKPYVKAIDRKSGSERLH